MKYYWSLQSWVGFAAGASHLYLIIEDGTSRQEERYTFLVTERLEAIRLVVDLVRQYRREGKSLHSRRTKYL